MSILDDIIAASERLKDLPPVLVAIWVIDNRRMHARILSIASGGEFTKEGTWERAIPVRHINPYDTDDLRLCPEECLTAWVERGSSAWMEMSDGTYVEVVDGAEANLH